VKEAAAAKKSVKISNRNKMAEKERQWQVPVYKNEIKFNPNPHCYGI
jgi:hypothetical protein